MSFIVYAKNLTIELNTMKYPKRMNLVNIEITPLVIDSRLMDEDFREPSKTRTFGTPYTITGQINYRTLDRQEPTLTGDEGQSWGRIVFEQAYINSLSVRPKVGDLITKVAGITVELKIVEDRPQGHLSGTKLIHYDFLENCYVRESE